MRPILAILSAAVILAGGPVRAEPSHGAFTFRRVAPPGEGQKRITVQIAPGVPVVYPAPAEPLPRSPRTPPVATGEGDPTGSYAWFWELISPALADAGPGRFGSAVAALATAPEDARVLSPRLQGMQALAERYGIEILKATIGTRVSPALALAVIAVESSGNPEAKSSAGAEGLMQLIPATAERFGVDDSLDPGKNIKGGVAYLDWLLKEFGGDALLALAGYNAGENAVKKHEGVPPFAETRDYVPKVLAAWDVARGLCATPPELPTDGCAFRVRSRPDG